MEFYAKISQKRLITEYSSDDEIVSGLKSNRLYKWKATLTRNEKFHKKFFGLLNLGFQNQDFHKIFEDYREVMIMRAGYFKTIPTQRGVIYRPKSISFSSMDETEFSTLYDAIFSIIASELNVDKIEIERELINFM